MRHRLATELLVLALLPLAGCVTDEAPGSGARAPAADAAAAGPGPAWWFTDTDGITHSRDSAAGRPTVLFFMATWCSTCRGKAPMVAAVQDDYADEGVRFLSASIDPQDEDARLEAWKARYGNEWPHGRDANASLQNVFGIRAQSSFVVLDGAGRPVATWQYPGASEDALRRAIDDALARGTA